MCSIPEPDLKVLQVWFNSAHSDVEELSSCGVFVRQWMFFRLLQGQVDVVLVSNVQVVGGGLQDPGISHI